jgi:hypothetical protein
MTIEGGVRAVAGTVVLLSVAVAHPKCPLYVSENFLFLTAFVGFMLVQSVFTGLCPTALVLKKLGLRSAEGGRPSPSP